MIRLALLDDHPAVLVGLQRVIEQEPDIVIVGAASSAPALARQLDNSTRRRPRRRPRRRALRRPLAMPAHQGPAATAGGDHLLRVRQADPGAARSRRARRRRRGQGGAGVVVARGDPYGRARRDHAAPRSPGRVRRRDGSAGQRGPAGVRDAAGRRERCPPSPTRCGQRRTRSRGEHSASSAVFAPAPPAEPTSGSWTLPAVACPSCPFAD